MGSTIATPPGPSLAAYLDATDWTYSQGAVPSGLTLLTAHEATTAGMFGAAFLTSSNQIIIAFEGTAPSETLSDSPFVSAEEAADLDLQDGLRPTATFAAAEQFVQTVIQTAAADNLGSDPIFVTGHSLGGVEAEYVSIQSGYGGATFGATGLPDYTSSSSAPDLVNYVEYGDPIGNFASGMSNALPVGAIASTNEPNFAPQMGMDHVGTVQLIGSPSDGKYLQFYNNFPGETDFLTNPLGNTLMYVGLSDQLRDHFISQYTKDLDNISMPTSGGALSFTTAGDIIDALDGVLRSAGDAVATTVQIVSDTIASSANFQVSIDLNNSTISIIQGQSLSFATQNFQSDAGTDTIKIDPGTGYVVNHIFNDSDTGNTVEFIPDNPVANLTDVTYQTGVSLLTIENPEDYTGIISNFQSGDTIDLIGVNSVESATFDANNRLSLQEPGNETVTLSLAPNQSFSNESFLLQSDGNGGTEITAVDNSQPIAFAGSNEILLVNNPGNLTAEISNFHTGDTIDLSGVGNPTGVSLGANGLLTVKMPNGGVTINLDPSEDHELQTFTATSDGNGGTDIEANSYTYSVSQISLNPAVSNNPPIEGFGINDAGEIVGSESFFTFSPQFSFYTNGIIYNSSATISNFPGAIDTAIQSINDKGDFVGDFTNAPYQNGFPFSKINGVYQQLNAEYASGINDNDDIVGYGLLDGSGNANSSSFIYKNGSYYTINVPGSLATYATGINNSDIVAGDYSVVTGSYANPPGVGGYSTSTEDFGFVYDNGSYSIIQIAGYDDIQIFGITADNKVLGTAISVSGELQPENFLYDANNGDITPILTDLPGYSQLSSQPGIISLKGISENGTILGTDADGPFVASRVACYRRGALVLSDQGEIEVERLSIGDHVVTLSGAIEPIRWIGRRSYLGRFIVGNRDILPVRIHADAIDDGVPRRGLWVSPLHAMFIDNVLVPAIELVNGVTIIQADAVESVEYFHIELDRHDVILAEGAPSETFVDDDSRMMFHNAHEYSQLYPDAKRVPALYCAPRVTEGFALEAIRHKIGVRAGIRPERQPEPLRGYLDHVSANVIRGWAQNPQYPEAPVCLDILVDGEVMAQTLASRHRPDLEAIGLGSGYHGFSVRLPAPLSERQIQHAEVRRSSDQMRLNRSSASGRRLGVAASR